MFNLILVTQKNHTPVKEYLCFIEACIDAGVTCVQLREKGLSHLQRFLFGKALFACLKPRGIPLIVNDDMHLAKALGADGVHLGQTDGNPIEARRHLGQDKTIGLSVTNTAQLQAALHLPINYIGIGPVFPTANKKDVHQYCGLDGLDALAAASPFPAIAIGGIHPDNIFEIRRTAVCGVAVIGALHTAEDLKTTCQQLLGEVAPFVVPNPSSTTQ